MSNSQYETKHWNIHSYILYLHELRTEKGFFGIHSIQLCFKLFDQLLILFALVNGMNQRDKDEMRKQTKAGHNRIVNHEMTEANVKHFKIIHAVQVQEVPVFAPALALVLVIVLVLALALVPALVLTVADGLLVAVAKIAPTTTVPEKQSMREQNLQIKYKCGPNRQRQQHLAIPVE